MDKSTQGQKGAPAGRSQSPWLSGWEKAQSLFHARAQGMPVPAWAARGFTDSGEAVWSRLQRILPEQDGPISIYAHMPFCLTRCPFCDCHAVAMRKGAMDQVKGYVDRFVMEARQWSALGGWSRRPVTTVHLGGGTPQALEQADFEKAVASLQANFAVSPQTEWAIETNCRLLEGAHLAQLSRLGFARIHVGLQTLQPNLRKMLGRRLAPREALQRIDACLERDVVVSADMLYGLPEQTADQLLCDLDMLVKAGIHGVSLYRLNHGSFNHRFMARHGLAERGEDRMFMDFEMFMEAAALLRGAGYEKNHFTHFARPADRNLYARHVIRGEDLLALGPTADGVFGDYYYRHGDLSAYLEADRTAPPLQGGSFYTDAERYAQGVISQLMAGRVFEDQLDETGTKYVRRLAEADLLLRDAPSRSWRLTDTGSWFIEKCTSEALQLYAGHAGTGPRKEP